MAPETRELTYLGSLNKEQIKTCQLLSQELWSFGRDLESRLKLLYHLIDSHFAEYCAVATTSDGKIVSSLTKYHITMTINGRKVKALGLGDIFTDTAERGKGYAAFLIRATLDEAAANGYEISTLFSYIPPTYYKLFGYTELKARDFKIPVIAACHLGETTTTSTAHNNNNNGNSHVDVDGKSEREVNPLTMTKVTSAADMKILRSIYQSEMSANFSLYSDRGGDEASDEHFNMLRNDNGPINDYLVFDSNGIVLGYFTVNVRESDEDPDGIQLDELIILKPYKSMELMIWRLVGKLAESLNKTYIDGWLPPAYPQALTKFIVDRQEAIPMIKFINPALEMSEESLSSNAYIGFLDHF